jgi:hypothetical protein
MSIVFLAVPCELVGAYKSTGGKSCIDNYAASRFKQDRRCTYNVIFGSIYFNIAAVEKQQVLHIVSVFL